MPFSCNLFLLRFYLDKLIPNGLFQLGIYIMTYCHILVKKKAAIHKI